MSAASSPSADATPKLAPPGAGLPKLELAVARLMFRWHQLTTSRAAASALIDQECAALVELARGIDPAKAARPVLIPRLRGLEDSSRNWSVFMTLEHVRIVNAACTYTIALLGRGKVPERAASTAAVKPPPGIDAAVIPALVEGCATLQRAAAALPDLHTPARYAHPWFGPLDAAGWHAMAGFHMRLHRQQVTAILARL